MTSHILLMLNSTIIDEFLAFHNSFFYLHDMIKQQCVVLFFSERFMKDLN